MGDAEHVVAAVAELLQLCRKGLQWQQLEGMPAMKALQVTPEMLGEREQGADDDLREDLEVRTHNCARR